MTTKSIQKRYRNVRTRIKSIAENCGRDPEQITLVAVTKGFDTEVIRRALDLGMTNLGENRVRKGLSKKKDINSTTGEIFWHMIGHLQSNKVKYLLGEFDLIHSVDRESLINELQKRLSRNELRQSVLMQVNTSGEESKHGVNPESAESLFESILEASQLDVTGLMTMAPYTDESDRLRRTFNRCRKLRDRLSDSFDVQLPELSMGMTNDYPEAIREGSTMLRIGRGIFGERPE